jgi:hydroxymethylpyrimidine pyrophosphatase-like HAD family hydrolase
MSLILSFQVYWQGPYDIVLSLEPSAFSTGGMRNAFMAILTYQDSACPIIMEKGSLVVVKEMQKLHIEHWQIIYGDETESKLIEKVGVLLTHDRQISLHLLLTLK